MRTVYILVGWDKLNHKEIKPDPGGFETEKEAELYCYKNSTPSLVLDYYPVRIGKLT